MSKSKEILRGAEIFVRALKDEGVEYIFGYPGGAVLHIYDALFKQDEVTHILTRHEQAAGFMAATYGRLTGKAGVCLATLGPGATNLVTAAAYAPQVAQAFGQAFDYNKQYAADWGVSEPIVSSVEGVEVERPGSQPAPNDDSPDSAR